MSKAYLLMATPQSISLKPAPPPLSAQFEKPDKHKLSVHTSADLIKYDDR